MAGGDGAQQTQYTGIEGDALDSLDGALRVGRQGADRLKTGLVGIDYDGVEDGGLLEQHVDEPAKAQGGWGDGQPVDRHRQGGAGGTDCPEGPSAGHGGV